MKTCLVLAVLTVACAPAPSGDLKSILNFESSAEAGELSGWSANRNLEVIPEATPQLDLEVFHAGRAAGRMDRGQETSGAFGAMSFRVPANFSGETIELRGWLKTENVEGGYAGLWLRLDAKSGGNVGFDNMSDRGLTGSTDWAEFRISLPLAAEASTIVLGTLLVGTGTVWTDDVELLVDGEPVTLGAAVGSPERLIYPASLGILALLVALWLLFSARARSRSANRNEALPARAQGAPRRVILFDGVCNLCTSAVQWVIARDRRGRFDFASLQSQVALETLREDLDERQIVDLPDSIVLVDAAGVHTRSSAALRIARQLGLPYSLATVGLLLPRFFRDGIYSWVARHRYRWFGRQETCMLPSSQLAARFLDAEEPRIEVPHRQPLSPQRKSWTLSFLTRFAVVYLLLYIAPFPFTTLASVVPESYGIAGFARWVVGLHSELMDPLIAWVGENAFSVEAKPALSGSGDRTYDYVTMATQLGLASILALLWTLVTRARRVSGMSLEVSRVLARFYLASFMLVYGWIKVFPLQFPTPPPSRLMQPIGDTSPMGLAWTFLGASVAYQILSGIAELIGGYLLFWRRTSLVGALVAVGVMANVMAINFCFDVPVKIFSTHLFLVALFILMADIPGLVRLLGIQLPGPANKIAPLGSRSGFMGLTLVVVHLVFVGMLTVGHVERGQASMKSRGPWLEPDPLAGIYRVESFIRDGVEDRANEDGDRWVQVAFSPPYVSGFMLANGDYKRTYLELSSTQEEGGVIRLEGSVDGKPAVILMRKETQGSLLETRGYRWINENPFNR